jgi:integrase
MATIRRRGIKWEAQIRRKGHRTISRSFETKTDAKTWARQIEVGLELGNLELPERSKTEIKLGDLVERYLAEVTKDKRGKEPEEYRLRRFLAHPICSKRVTELKTEDFAAYRDQRLRKVAPSTVKRELAIVQHAIEVARAEWGIQLRDNPLANLRLNVPNDQRDRRLQPGELDRLLTAASATRTKHLSEIILFAIETGMRRGEIVSIRWKDVDLQRRSVRLTQTKNGHPRSNPPEQGSQTSLTKTRRARTTPSCFH